MIKDIKKDHLIGSFLDSLYIEKGLSKNTVSSYKNDISSFSNWLEKNNINLKYILNTHHHYDHVGGNKKLKKKYNSKIIGFKDDKKRIPEIDILVENNQIWKEENFEAK